MFLFDSMMLADAFRQMSRHGHASPRFAGYAFVSLFFCRLSLPLLPALPLPALSPSPYVRQFSADTCRHFDIFHYATLGEITPC